MEPSNATLFCKLFEEFFSNMTMYIVYVKIFAVKRKDTQKNYIKLR